MRIAKTTLDIIITGKLIDTETVMISLEGGGWKSASNGNSLATYPTVRTVLSERCSGQYRTSTQPEMLVKTPAELETQQVDELIQWMVVQWAVKRGMQHNHALDSFRKHIPAIIKEGYTEVDAIGLWMEYVQQQAEQKLSMSVG